jgi:predicted N-acetyltransferase YhbS
MPDGPRALHPGEWEQLDHAVSAVFRPEMFHDYPQLFNEANRDNLRVVAEDGKIVAHVGYIARPASLMGCRIDVANIGAVATLSEYRGRGFASACFQDACEQAARDGVDIMLISGGRGLYTRVGCRQVGRELDFSFTADDAAPLGSAHPPGAVPFTLAPVGADHLPALRGVYAAEPVRFIRRREDWEMAIECGVVMNTASDFWGVFAGDGMAAYLVVHQPSKVRRRNPDDPTVTRVVEYAGQRAAVAFALPRLLERYRTDRVTIHVAGVPAVFPRVLEDVTGRQGTPAGASGTLRVINFVQLMERCRPLLAERMGHAAASELTFHADAPPGSPEGGFAIRRGTGEIRIPDLASLALYLFGTSRPITAPDASPTGPDELLALMDSALPLPALWYGISYV